jgi:hypothetical protein
MNHESHSFDLADDWCHAHRRFCSMSQAAEGVRLRSPALSPGEDVLRARLEARR